MSLNLISCFFFKNLPRAHVFMSFCDILKLLTWSFSHNNSKDVLDISIKYDQSNMLGRIISRKYFHCGNYNMIPMRSRLDKVKIRITGKDREKHVAKPQRALTAPNRPADEGWKRRAHTFSAPLSIPTNLTLLSLSSCSQSCNDRYNYFIKFIIFNKNNLIYIRWNENILIILIKERIV